MRKYNVYLCSDCELRFAIDQEFEDQSVVDCPLCHTDYHLVDAGEAVDVDG